MYKSVPHGWPEPGKDLAIESTDFDVNQTPPKNGITTKNYYAAYDPSQRGRMRDPSIKSYLPAMTPGEPVTSVSIIGRVLKSDHSNFKEGDLVIIAMGTEEYSIVSESQLKAGYARVINNKKGLPLTAYLGAMGMTGLTAYGSFMEIGRPKKGETIWVTAAAGAVGQMVGQFAVREGLKVIGSVGDDEKLEYITKELGFTSGFNYKKENAADALQRLAPDGIDIFYDNVGGEQLDLALTVLKEHGRIVACGSISQYNNKPGEGYGVKNYPQMVRKRLRWEGFLVLDENIVKHLKDRDEKVSEWILDGSIKTTDHVTHGMDKAIDGFLGMLKGENLGKSILKIADPDET